MKLKHKLIAAAAAALLVAAAAGWIVSDLRLARLERFAREQNEAAAQHAVRADQLEKQTYVYKEKIEHLEARLAELRRDAQRRDAGLEKLAADTDAARRELDRIRRGSGAKR